MSKIIRQKRTYPKSIVQSFFADWSNMRSPILRKGWPWLRTVLLFHIISMPTYSYFCSQYPTKVRSIPLGEVSWESCSDSSLGDPLMSCTPLQKAAKPVWAKQLTRLNCLAVYVKFKFVYTTEGNNWLKQIIRSFKPVFIFFYFFHVSSSNATEFYSNLRKLIFTKEKKNKKNNGS